MTGGESTGSPRGSEEDDPAVRSEDRRSRGSLMEARVLRAAREAGLGPEDNALLVRAHRAAMKPRAMGATALPSAQHPAFLHPGRTALILLNDVEEVSPGVLAAGLLAETRDGALRVSATTVLGVCQGATAAPGVQWWRELPRPDWHGTGGLPDGELLERLVAASEPVRRIALSEALDHLRHAHLWRSRAERVRAAELADRVFGPLAPRVHPTLDRRVQWWLRRVGRVLR